MGARKSLNLLDLAESTVLRGITPSHGGSLAEAASVCLDDQGHGPIVLLEVVGAFDAEFELVRQGVTDEIRMSHNDLLRAAEDGACGVAVLLVRELTGWSEQSLAGPRTDNEPGNTSPRLNPSPRERRKD